MPHWQQQLGRFARLTAVAFLIQAGAFDWNHLTRSALISAAVGALEVAYRQMFPTNAVQ